MNQPVQITEARGTARAANGSGLLDIQIITPGRGSSGYYPPQVLEQAGRDRVLPKGTHMYIDHPTLIEQEERPNRSVKDLAAVLTEDAHWDGTGLRATARTFAPWRQAVAEMAEAIGVSIRADAQVSEGEAPDGEYGVIIEQITSVRSVDFVSQAGRGGRILEVLESARNDAVEAVLTENQQPDRSVSEPENLEPGETGPAPGETPPATEPPPSGGTQDPTAEPVVDPADGESETTNQPSQEEHVTEISTSTSGQSPRQVMEAKFRAQQEHIVLLEARDTARPIIREGLSDGNVWLTPRVVARLTEELMSALPIKDGALDEPALIKQLQRKVNVAESELGEILEAAGLGTPKGLGSTAVEETLNANYQASQKKAFMELGLSEEAADVAVRGR